MKNGKLVNLLIGITIALLPLYTRVSMVDFNRTSKDNLLVVLFGVFGFLLPDRERELPRLMLYSIIYFISMLVLNQFNVISIQVMFQVFYIASGIFFFVNYYEKHDRDSLDLILNGAAIGCIIQSVLAIGNYFGISIYGHALEWLASGKSGVFGAHVAGSLGNSGLLASYLAITMLALFRKNWFLAIPLCLTALVLTKSDIAIAAFFGGVFYYGNTLTQLFKKWELYAWAILGMALVFIFGESLGLDSGRFEAWKYIISRADFSHWAIGRGAGWFSSHHFIMRDSSVLIQEHNEFLSFFNIFGITGLILVAPFFIKILFTEDEFPIFSSMLFVAFCNSFGHFSLHQSTTALIMIVTACVCMGQGNSYGRNLDGF